MTRSAMTALLGPEFDAFLFAPVDEEAKGALLSVVSALARLDVDPWQEAAALAGMPRAAASQRLTSLIAALPDAATARRAPARIAERLIKLLPHRDGAPEASREKLLRADTAPTYRAVVNLVLINFLLMAGMLCAQWAFAGLQPAHRGPNHAAAPAMVAPRTPQPIDGE
jgi:hypothetical protein